MADINHEIKIQASPEKIFKALSHVDDLKAWHTAYVSGSPELNGIIEFKSTDRPTFHWKVTKFEPNQMIVWECVEGPGNSVGTKAHYKISQTNDERTLVELSHTAWPDQEGNFRKCNTLWGILLHHLKNYVETDKSDPAIQ